MLPISRMFVPRLGATLLFSAVLAPWGWSQTAPHSGHGHVAGAERLGRVEFKVECNAAAQAEFTRAMALYHSFWWPAASTAFETVAQADPTCGMAHWGRAMVILDNPFTWPANLAPKMKDVAAALDAARSTGLKSQREKDYVEAVAAFVRDHEKVDHRTRLQAYDDAMAQLAERYPDDKEAAILSALVTSANFNPADKTYANQLKAAKGLERFVASDPDHPGVAHYMIHSYDYPAIAKHGVEAAKKYATIAPDSPHALHMPSHIFTRLGYWRESIEANRASSRTASDATFDAHHAHDYLVYAHLQLAQDHAAREALERSRSMKLVDHVAAAYAYAAMPARLALERNDWKEAMNLPLTPAADAYPWKKYPQSEAVNAFARAIGAALSGDAAAAKEQQARLIALREAANEAKLGYWVEQIDIQADIAGSLAYCAEGRSDECIEGMRKAAAREDATEKHVVTPGPIIPARELLADLLLASGKAADALKEYENVLNKEPNRYRAVLGAARAATRVGNESRARELFKQLAELGKDADSARDGLDEARQSVSRG
jgi:Tetratricopeptide repeat